MNPKEALGIAVLVIVALLVGAYFLEAHLSGETTRRRTLHQMEKALETANDTILKIEEQADQYRDIDSPLATVVRSEIRKYRQARGGI